MGTNEKRDKMIFDFFESNNISEIAKAVGCHPTYLYRIKNGHLNLTDKMATRIEAVYDQFNHKPEIKYQNKVVLPADEFLKQVEKDSRRKELDNEVKNIVLRIFKEELMPLMPAIVKGVIRDIFLVGIKGNKHD